MMRDEISEIVVDFQARLASLRGDAAFPLEVGGGPRLAEAEKLVSQAIEELRVTDEELREQNEAFGEVRQRLEAELGVYRDLFSYAPDAYLATDLGGIIRHANHMASQILGVPPPRLVGKPVAVYLAPSQRRALRDLLQRAPLQADLPLEWATTLQPRGGKPVPARARIGVARDLLGRCVGLCWLVRADAAARHPLAVDDVGAATVDRNPPVEAALRQRFGGVLRDLRNPVLVMMDQARFLAERVLKLDGRDPTDVAMALSTIAATAGDTLASIDEVRDALDLQAGLPLALDLDASDLLDLAQRVVWATQSTTERREVALEPDESTRPGMIGYWDEERLERALSNVLATALRESPDNGRIVVRVSRAIGDDRPLANIVIEHRLGTDEGGDGASGEPGRHAVLQRTNGRIRGESLGLAGARRIVEQHGGRLEVGNRGPRRRSYAISLPFDSAGS